MCLFVSPSFSFSSICESAFEVLVLYNVAHPVPILVLRGLFRILFLALMFGAHIALGRVDFLLGRGTRDLRADIELIVT